MSDVLAERATWDALIAHQRSLIPSDFWSVNQMRAHQDAFAPAGDIAGVKSRGTVAKPGYQWTAEWTRPLSPAAGTLLHLCGALPRASSFSYRRLAAGLCVATPAYVLTLNYRRPPEVHYPAPLEDTLSTLEWLDANKHPMSKVILTADSFGAVPALAATIHRRNLGLSLPQGIYLLCPKADYSSTRLRASPSADPDICPANQAMWGYFDTVLATDVRASPQLDDLSGLPPVLMHATTADSPAMYAGQQDLKARLIAASNDFTYREWEVVPHAWPYHGDAFTAGAEALTAAAAWIRERLS